MTNLKDTLSEMRKRLDDLEARLEAQASRERAQGPLAAPRERSLAEIQAQAAALRARLQGARDLDWETVKRDLKKDWDILDHAFARWVEHVDRDY